MEVRGTAKLPVPPTPLIGREREQAAVSQLLRAPAVRPHPDRTDSYGVGRDPCATGRSSDAPQPAAVNGLWSTATRPAQGSLTLVNLSVLPDRFHR
jgi:hypothetical protein